jgi:hypothetical protein
MENNKNNTKKLRVRVYCQAYYHAVIDAPADMTNEEMYEYLNENLDYIPTGELRYLADSDNVDMEDIEFGYTGYIN